jgi:hypothetical protein
MIRKLRHRIGVGAVLAGLSLSGCGAAGSAASAPDEVKPIVQSAPDGEQLVVVNRVEASRIGLQTEPVRPAAGGGGATTIPFAALLYDEHGVNWVFVRTSTGAFERQRVTVARIVGDTVVLSTGPAVGTPVVTVGAPELLGAQLGVGGE